MLFGASPDLIADFSGDQSVPNVEVVDQPHLHFRANRQRTVLKSVADDAEGGERVIKHTIRRRPALDRRKLEILNAIERQDFNVLTQRPVISKPRKLWLVARAAAGKLL